MSESVVKGADTNFSARMVQDAGQSQIKPNEHRKFDTKIFQYSGFYQYESQQTAPAVIKKFARVR